MSTAGENALPMTAEADAPSVEEYNAFVLKHTWWNIWFNVYDGVLFTMGMALVPPETVLPAFINDLAARAPGFEQYRNSMVGFLGFITAACFMMPQQLWAARLCEGRPLLKRLLIVLGLLERLPWLAMGMMAAYVAGRNPRLALYLFFGIVFAWQMSVGVVSPVWQEMVAKVTPVNRRGLLFGIRESIGGALGFATLVVANRFVPQMEFPGNYTALLGGLFGLIMVSWFGLFFLREMPYPVRRERRPFAAHVGDMWGALRHDKAFGRFFACRSVLGMTGIAASSFFAMRAIDVLGSEASVKLMVEMAMVIMISRAVVSVVIGPAGDRFGYRAIMAFAGASGAGGVAFALFAQGVTGFHAAYALSTFSGMAFYLGHTNYILEIAPPEKRPTYISLDNMSGLPFVATPFIGGWLADRVGYTAPFAVGIVFGLASAVMFLTIAVEPRKAMRRDLVS